MIPRHEALTLAAECWKKVIGQAFMVLFNRQTPLEKGHMGVV
jgi:hypothetical protein